MTEDTKRQRIEAAPVVVMVDGEPRVMTVGELARTAEKPQVANYVEVAMSAQPTVNHCQE